jgi:hypothetical protein
LAQAQAMISENQGQRHTHAIAVAGWLGITALSAATGTLDHYPQNVLANRSRLLAETILYWRRYLPEGGVEELGPIIGSIQSAISTSIALVRR